MTPVIRPSRRAFQLIAYALLCCACDEGTSPPAPLTLVSISPAGNATRVGVADTIRLVFSSAVDLSTVTAASVNVTSPTPVAGALAVQGSTVTFVPTNPLTEFRTQYSVNVTTAV